MHEQTPSRCNRYAAIGRRARRERGLRPRRTPVAARARPRRVSETPPGAPGLSAPSSVELGGFWDVTPQDLGISARADQRSLERRITHAGSSEIEIKPLPIGNGIEIEISTSGITHNPKTQSMTVDL